MLNCRRIIRNVAIAAIAPGIVRMSAKSSMVVDESQELPCALACAGAILNFDEL
jgi:hypothetical protein